METTLTSLLHAALLRKYMRLGRRRIWALLCHAHVIIGWSDHIYVPAPDRLGRILSPSKVNEYTHIRSPFVLRSSFRPNGLSLLHPNMRSLPSLSTHLGPGLCHLGPLVWYQPLTISSLFRNLDGRWPMNGIVPTSTWYTRQIVLPQLWSWFEQP